MHLQRGTKMTALSLVAATLAAGPAAAREVSATHSQAVLQRRALVALHTISASRPCGAACRAAYRVVAAALPGDRANVVTRAILRTPNIDYHLMTVALGAPTIPEIRAEWRASCKRWFPGSKSLERWCFQFILGPPGARPVS